MCLIKNDLDNYVSPTEGTRQSRALVEGAGVACWWKGRGYRSSRVNEIFLGWEGSIWSNSIVVFQYRRVYIL
jgi:hypothetical protein